MKEAQESLRLSASQQQKLNKELNEYKGRLSQEEETNRQKMKKLSMENASLADEINTSQENLRLSAGQIAKLNNDLRKLQNENEELRGRAQENGVMRRKITDLEASIVTFSQEIDRLNAII